MAYIIPMLLYVAIAMSTLSIFNLSECLPDPLTSIFIDVWVDLMLSARYCFSCQKCEDYFTVKGRSARVSQCLSGLRLFLDYC